MKNIALLSVGLAATCVGLLAAAPTYALNSVSFVSPAGTGSSCTRAAPCSLIGQAHDQALPGGEVHCLNSGPFDTTLDITKSITINCAGTAISAISVNGAGI